MKAAMYATMYATICATNCATNYGLADVLGSVDAPQWTRN